jgi:uncharacterized membrane protein
MKGLLQFIKATVVGGLLFLVPIIILVMTLEKGMHLAGKFVTPLVAHFPDKPVLGMTAASLAAAVVLIILSFVAGLAAQTAGGQKFVAWLEKVFLSKMPGYMMFRGMVGDMSNSMETLAGGSKARTVFVSIEDAWQIGFVMDTLPSGEVAVYVPGAPSPFSGSLYFMAPDRVRDCSLSVFEAQGLLRRLGSGASETVKQAGP